MTASHSASVMLMITRSRRIPALLTSTCRSPNASMACWTSRWAPFQSATFSPLTTASPPSALISSTVCIAALGSPPSPCMSPPRSLTTTRAPSLAKRSACSRPRPRPAPVMIATLPSSAPMSGSCSSARGGAEWYAVPGRFAQPLRPASVLTQHEIHLRVSGHLLVGSADGVLGHHDTAGPVVGDGPDLQTGGGEDGGRLLDRLERHVGHDDEVGALRHVHGHDGSVGRAHSLRGIGADHVTSLHRR